MKARLTILFAGLSLVAAAVLARAVSIQIIGDERVGRLAKSQFTRKFIVRPRRGPILDRNGEPLAISVESFSLAADPRKLKPRGKTSRKLGRILGLKSSLLRKKFASSRSFVWIKRHLSEKELHRLEKAGLIGSQDPEQGFWLVKESKRAYPQGRLAAHVLGFVNVDGEGLEGVELWKDSVLSGSGVKYPVVRDALGRPTFLDPEKTEGLANGEPVRLSLDSTIQFEIERHLDAAMKRNEPRSAMAIVMNASTGEILGAAGRPAFHPGELSGPTKFRRNRLITDTFEPGSTFKPLLMAAALVNGWKPDDRVWGGLGQVVVQGKRITEAESDEKFEWITLKDMVRVSSNVVAAKLAMELGSENYIRVLRDLGFGSRTGSGFPGEAGGWLPSIRDKVQPLSLANMGFGQGLTVTALQMASAFSVIQNGGWRVAPTFFPGEEGEVETRRVIPSEVAETVTSAMLEVTGENGTGAAAALEGYRVAGKTGTAQVVDPETKTYSRKRYISSFVGFATGVEPKVTVYVALDGPKGNYYAASTAAPLFKDVLNSVARRFGFPSDPGYRPGFKLKEVLSRHRQGTTGESPRPEERAIRVRQAAPVRFREGKMPDLTGLSPREVFRALEPFGLEIRVRGSGVVAGQEPSAGTALTPGKIVHLRLDE